MTEVAALTAWTGWDLRGGARAPANPVEAFLGSAPLGSGPEARYELLAVTGRGFRPPRFLSVIDLAEKGSGELERGSEPGEGLRETWSVIYQRVATTAPRAVNADAIYLLGVDPPENATEEELAVFNDFYTYVHLPEVAARRNALRAERYELVQERRAPYPRAPRYLAVYELDAADAAHRRHVGPPYAAGPEVWERHTTPWRLWYRNLALSPNPGSA